MGSSENLCLRWNDFQSNMTESFRSLRQDSDLFDVTLACNDGQDIRAHKVILATCSNLFKGIIKRLAGNPSPLVYLRGVKSTDLQLVLDFMYYGQVSVEQDRLDGFLAVAEDLQVKGLTQPSEPGGTKQEQRQVGPSKRTVDRKESVHAKRRRQTQESSDEIIQVEEEEDSGVDHAAENIKSESENKYDDGGEGGDLYVTGEDAGFVESGSQIVANYEEGNEDDGDGAATNDDAAYEDDLKEDSRSPLFASSDWRVHVLALPDGQGRCVPCNKIFKRLPAAKRHYEVIHAANVSTVECCYCQKIFNEFAFRTHLNTKHNIRGVKNVLQLYGKVIR